MKRLPLIVIGELLLLILDVCGGGDGGKKLVAIPGYGGGNRDQMQ